MIGDPRIIGIILCLILPFAAGARDAGAATGLTEASKGKGTRLGLAFADQKTAPASSEEVKQTINLLEARMKQFGVSSAIIEPSQAEGEALQVLLPPGTDLERATRLLTYVGLMELKLIARDTSVPYDTKAEAEAAARELEGGLDKYEAALYRTPAEGGAAPKKGWVILEKTPIITGADVSNAQAGRSEFPGRAQVDFQVTPNGAARLGEATGRHVGDHIAIVLNNEVRSAPVIASQITDRAQISGDFTVQAAEDLAIILRTGSLTRALYVVSRKTIDASRWPADRSNTF